ncbi:MAG: MBL fold metallo-hydrolase [Planctomycetes bacterium]|nr:MBL fold metallo-hydrolase [Planctomycetota bacterium]
MYVERIYDEDLSQAAWMIGCQATGEAIIIDPERDVCRYLELAERNDLTITAITETHIHADFLSGTMELANATGARCYLSDHGGDDWSYQWPNHSDADVTLVRDGDTICIGNISITVVHTPGHTPEHICFLVHDKDTKEAIGYATGDFVFVGDLGRPDLLETAAGLEGVMVASAQQLHDTCVRFMDMEEYVQIWPAHGAGSACGKALGAVPQSTVGYEKRTSPPLQLVGDETAFVDFMLTGQPEPPLYFARMKQMNRDGMALLGGLPTPKKIKDTTELARVVSSATVIDTRPWEEVREGHLPNTIWSKANNDFHRFAGSFVDATEEIVLIVSSEELDRALRNAIRIGLDNLVAWVEPELLDNVEGLESMPEITSSELAEMHNPSVLDVRRLLEFEDGAIDGALNVAHTRLLDRLEFIDKTKTWVVNCHGGSRSAAACMALKRNGYNVMNLAGGYKGWKQQTNCCTL